MLKSLKWSRPDGTFVGVMADGREWHLTQGEPYWKEALLMAQQSMPPLEPPPSQPVLDAYQVMMKCKEAVDAHMDSVAQTRRYDNRHTILSWVNTDHEPTWQAEARAFDYWRVQVVKQVNELLNYHQQYTDEPLPTPEEVVDSLPLMVWPS